MRVFLETEVPQIFTRDRSQKRRRKGGGKANELTHKKLMMRLKRPNEPKKNERGGGGHVQQETFLLSPKAAAYWKSGVRKERETLLYSRGESSSSEREKRNKLQFVNTFLSFSSEWILFGPWRCHRKRRHCFFPGTLLHQHQSLSLPLLHSCGYCSFVFVYMM